MASWEAVLLGDIDYTSCCLMDKVQRIAVILRIAP